MSKTVQSRRCPHCRREVPLLPDGSFAMHGRDDGSLCRGTNCTMRADIKAFTICGVRIPVTNAFTDPDGLGMAEES
jgi:hypothetical protein